MLLQRIIIFIQSMTSYTFVLDHIVTLKYHTCLLIVVTY